MTVKQFFTSKPILIVEFAIILLFAFRVGQEVLKRRAIEGEIHSLETEIGKLETQKSELGALLSYIETDSFVRNEARDKLNLAEPGEHVVVIPDVDTESPVPGEEHGALQAPSDQPQTTNLKRWWQYFFDHDKLWID